MKNSLILLLAIILMTGCYDDFRVDNTFTGVAFSSADGGSNVAGVLHRTVVKDEGLKLDMGINLTGVLDNQKERWAQFEIDPAILNEDAFSGLGYELMPSDYYTLSNTNRFVIPAGSYLGKVTITLDSARFISDPKAVNHIYAIPFRLTDTSEDSINANLSTKILVIKYINHYEGSYDQEGTIISYDASGAVIDSVEVSNVIAMTTVREDTVVTDGMLNSTGAAYQMLIHVNPDKSVLTENTPSSANNAITQNGTCSFDKTNSVFTLNYKVTTGSGSYKIASMQLTWRNRIRDGINEWRR
ncbi:BT_3987 domain-containing protein [Saccharicrinis sp. FJH54]|uniref:BT_3987 domain-containing protein n=1 Tax=Saccharicrinis sp. FJH54 TaxID=3344665 RepID=UPI0035D4F041